MCFHQQFSRAFANCAILLCQHATNSETGFKRKPHAFGGVGAELGDAMGVALAGGSNFRVDLVCKKKTRVILTAC